MTLKGIRVCVLVFFQRLRTTTLHKNNVKKEGMQAFDKNVLCPNLMNLSRGLNLPINGFN
jgi:hypothetical protein